MRRTKNVLSYLWTRGFKPVTSSDRTISSSQERTMKDLPLPVAEAARSVSRRLEAAGVSCAIVGAVACAAYGHVRATTDVNVLINAHDADTLRSTLVGHGWMPRFPGARKMLRDILHGVDVDVLYSGGFPGDGLPKPVSFPELSSASTSVEIFDGARVISLPLLIDLKLASGSSAPSRGKDLADVYALIASNHLPRCYANELDVSVRAAYCKIWDDWQAARVSGIDP